MLSLNFYDQFIKELNREMCGVRSWNARVQPHTARLSGKSMTCGRDTGISSSDELVELAPAT